MGKLILLLADKAATGAGGPVQEETDRRQDIGNQRDFACELQGVENSAGLLDIVIQDSFDGGVTWNTLLTFDQLDTTEGKVADFPRHPGPLLGILRTSTGDWDYTVRIAANPLR